MMDFVGDECDLDMRVSVVSVPRRVLSVYLNNYQPEDAC